jgi:hypothetical protein
MPVQLSKNVCYGKGHFNFNVLILILIVYSFTFFVCLLGSYFSLVQRLGIYGGFPSCIM